MLSHMGKKLQVVTLMYFSKCLGANFSLHEQNLFLQNMEKAILKAGGGGVFLS